MPRPPGPPTRIRQLVRRLGPRAAVATVRRQLARRARRRAGVERRMVTLPAVGRERGRVLLSYIIDPFLLPADSRLPHDHTHFWESREMARAWCEAGFAVDCIHWTNHAFVPTAAYAVAIDVRLNLEHWLPRLPPGCLRVLHAETSHWRTNNGNQRARLARIEHVHGIRLAPRKLVEENRAAESAQVITLLGNAFTAESYAFTGCPRHRIPISTPERYDWPTARDLGRARRRFLWFGSGGMVHKGLDLVLEAFAGLPRAGGEPPLELVVCGPVDRERDFEAAYWRELYATPGIRTLGWVDVRSSAFPALCASAVGVVFPSCAEGGGGSVITCMHAGLLPIVSREASVDVPPGGGVELGEATVEAIRAAITAIAAASPESLETMTRTAYEHVGAHHTRERFAARYREVVAELIAGLPAAAESR